VDSTREFKDVRSLVTLALNVNGSVHATRAFTKLPHREPSERSRARVARCRSLAQERAGRGG
jgi:hypothetical protein